MAEPGTTAAVGRVVLHLSPTSKPLDRAAAALAVSREARRLADDHVAEARRQGQTWAATGAALGVSRQTAFERFRNSEHHGPYARSNRVGTARGSTGAERRPR
jgi:hypothetical protein